MLCPEANQVRALIDDAWARISAPLIEPELVVTNSDATTKAEAIQQAVDRLYVVSRTQQPRLVEHAVWKREEEHSTGFGHGFAIPHCKNCAVQTNSLVVLKPRKPIPWDSLDGKPVTIVILVAIRETDPGVTHMKILSTLARKIMHEEFRQRLSRNEEPATICAFLKDSLGLAKGEQY
jgi:fructose-specific phosphotransferase system IIA component